MKYARWTRQADELLKEMSKAGHSATEIAFVLNRTLAAVYVRRRKLCATKERSGTYPVTSDQVDFILEHYPKRGWNARMIADHLEIPQRVVYYQAKKFGLKSWSYEEWVLTPAEKKLIKRQRMRGVGYVSISKQLNVPHRYVKRWVEENI